MDSFGLAIAEFGNFALGCLVWALGFGIFGLASFGRAVADCGNFVWNLRFRILGVGSFVWIPLDSQLRSLETLL